METNFHGGNLFRVLKQLLLLLLLLLGKLVASSAHLMSLEAPESGVRSGEVSRKERIQE